MSRSAIVGGKKSYELREPAIPYGTNFTPESGLLRLVKTPVFGAILYKYQQDSLVRPQATSAGGKRRLGSNKFKKRYGQILDSL